jgi:glycosyltransferase involved in cell wall biosynthesis
MPVILDARVVSGTGGGPDKTILNSPRFLEAMGYRNLYAYLHPPEDPGFESLRRKAEAWNAPLISISDRGPLDWHVVPKLLDVCRQERVAIWHGHDYKSNALGLLLRRFHPMRLATTVHGWVKHTRRTPLYYGIDRICLKHYQAVISVSDDLLERCLDCGVPQDRCFLIENAIDLRQFSRTNDREEAKKRLRIPANRLLIGAIGRLSEEKGFDSLILAVDQLLAQDYDVELLIAGEGDQQEHLASLIRARGRDKRIRLAGFQADTIPLYEAMDAFVLSSLREGLPNVVLEAMAMEVPVIATKVAGIPRLIQHGRNGLLIEPGSISALTDSLTSLLQDGPLRDLLAQGGRATIEQNHSFEVRMEKIRAVYDRLLGRDLTSPFSSKAVPIS